MAEATEGQNMSGGHIAIDVLDSAFVDPIQHRLSETTRSLTSNEQPTIYGVPEPIRQYEKEAYEPRLVSIGPYHRNKQSLQPMEEHKWRYLHAILSRNKAVSLKDYLEKIKAVEERARKSYSERIELDSNEFLKMMLLDGCFIVELFAKRLKKDGNDDPIYGNWRLLETVCLDMLLLENQLPYCILQCIFSCVFPKKDVKLEEKAIEFCRSLLWLPLCRNRCEVESFHHLLHLIHFHCHPVNLRDSTDCSEVPNINSHEQTDCWRHRTIPSVQELKEFGIKFKSQSHKDSVQAVEFKNGEMEIRYLFIDAFIIGVLRNFLAFEQCYRSAGSYFTIYTAFMDSVINTKADVELLRDKGVLHHACGSDEELALLLSDLTKVNPVGIHDRHLSSLFKNVNEYCGKKWPRWRAILMRDYFGNPWSIIAVIGAIVTLILTAIQSFFSVYAYVRPLHQS